MNLRALSFGAVLGFLVAVIPSCGTPACGPTNCDGCCDAANKCVPVSASSSDTSCGQKGTTCSNCAATGAACSKTLFVCETHAGTGGGTGGGTTGGGTGTGGGTTGGGTGTGGGTTGGGTGGGTTGGGTGGGTTGGGATGCNIALQNCTGANESCFLTNASGSTQCFAGACNLVTQNCPNGGKCSYAGLADGGVERACGAAGVKTEGQACGASQMDDCATGLICLADSKCHKFCNTDVQCGANAACASYIDIGGSPEKPLFCVPVTACDPLTQNCAAGEGCYLSGTGPLCNTAGTVAAGAVCGQTQGNCVKGSVCLLTSATAGACHQFCNRDAGMPNCGAGQCGGLLNPVDGGVMPWGACQ